MQQNVLTLDYSKVEKARPNLNHIKQTQLCNKHENLIKVSGPFVET